MDAFYDACIALYNTAFPDEPEVFTKALFDCYYPDHLRTICEDGTPVSMLFSIPYPLITEKGERKARYLYAVATRPDHRGKGLAKQLLLQEVTRSPVFLRPMSESLFDYYGRIGFSPISPTETVVGDATAPEGSERLLSAIEFLTLRARLAPLPHCRPTEAFLSLYENGGGAVAHSEHVVALYERHGDKIFFKEYWGDPVFAPRLAAFLGGTRFALRRHSRSGTPFGMGIGIPESTAFLAALD